ncbi:MAG: hypothetical protein ABH983_02770 [Candidatus Micrarchaeota archaeon]
MAKGADYNIIKREKGPLQRFKNQNLLIKKFGEVGLQIYKAITGKRSTGELCKDLGIEKDLFDQIVNYMQDAGMVELEPVTTATNKDKDEFLPSAPEEPEAVPMQKISHDDDAEDEVEIQPDEEIAPDDAISAEDDFSFDVPSEEEEPLPPEESSDDEIQPIDAETPPKKSKTSKSDDGFKPFEFEDIQPVDDTGLEIGPEEEEPKVRQLDDNFDDSSEEELSEEEPLEASSDDSDMSLSAVDDIDEEQDSDLSPVEKIISDKYGDLGIQVYALIDGQRTAEEIMRETGLTESKLVEILDFMDEQGIIKLDYPKGGGSSKAESSPPPNTRSFTSVMAPPPQSPSYAPPRGAPQAPKVGADSSFNPILEGGSLDGVRGISSPVELPIKAPLDIVKSVQMKAKVMLKFGDKGNKIIELINGKNDILDISLKMELPLFEIAKILHFLMENGMLIMKPLSRTDVRKKYGDDGYSVYKKYGKEGLMLYELIGKEMTIQQMADMITEDKSQIIDMFIFIHQVLGIELPIDRDVLSKQLGI